MRERKQWNKLDNAAKIFPPTSSKKDTKVFRFVCELTEPVYEVALQQALDDAIEKFPLYRSILKKGLFWYYFEESDIKPIVTEETLPPCSPLYKGDEPVLLFRVTYYKSRINFEIFHALSDGAGAMKFFRTLVFSYLKRRYGISGTLGDHDAAQDEMKQDAFYQYYDKNEAIPKVETNKAYRIRGEHYPENKFNIIEGFLPVSAVLEKAREHGATLSEFLVANLVCAVHDNMAARDKRKPVVVAVPVNLRKYFPAQTARNFFGVTFIPHFFNKDGVTFDEVLANVQKGFRSNLTKENLYGIIGKYSAIENNPFIKAIPLQLKILFLRIGGLWAERKDTVGFSNVGAVVMPTEAEPYIKMFDVFFHTKRPQMCLCTFGDTLAINIASALVDPAIIRRFFMNLTEMGLPVEIVSNLEQIRNKEDAHVKM